MAIPSKEDVECRSLLKKHLTRTKLDSLKKLKTKYGGTLAHCIRSGCLNTDSEIGIYACDPDAYKIFGDLFIPVIKDYHVVTGAMHPSGNFGERLVRLGSFGIDTDPVQIESTTISVARSLEGFPFPPLLTTAKRKHLEDMSKAALLELRGDFRGVYCSLATMGKETMKALVNRNLLFVNDNRFLDSAGVYKQWPEGRSIFYNDKKNFAAWVNEEDHLKLICTQPGGDIRNIYLRTTSALRLLESSGLSYAWKEYLGYLYTI